MMAQGSGKGSILKKHRVVLKDFYKFQLPAVLGYTLTAIACAAAALMLSENGGVLFWASLAVVVFMTALLIILLISVLRNAPMKYAEQVADFPEDVQDELLLEYSSAKKVGTQRYMSRVMVFFRVRNIYAVQYKDITGAAPKNRDLLLYLKDSEEPLRIPCPANNMSAIVFAYLRSKNPDIKIIGSADRKETTV